jgi:anti-sigma B factor antagonist
MATGSTLDVEVEHSDGAMMVRMKGEACLQCADDLDRYLMPVVALRPKNLVVDLSGLNFISSLGLGALIELQREIAQLGGSVRFAAAQPLIRDIFAKCKLDRSLKLYPTVEAALHPTAND